MRELSTGGMDHEEWRTDWMQEEEESLSRPPRVFLPYTTNQNESRLDSNSIHLPDSITSAETDSSAKKVIFSQPWNKEFQGCSIRPLVRRALNPP